jgi:hypothetical protein
MLRGTHGYGLERGGAVRETQERSKRDDLFTGQEKVDGESAAKRVEAG